MLELLLVKEKVSIKVFGKKQCDLSGHRKDLSGLPNLPLVTV